MEEKIYKRQVTKQAMFHRQYILFAFLLLSLSQLFCLIDQGVIDAKQLARHFTYDELAQLYQFDFDHDDDPSDRYDFDRIQDKLLQDLANYYRDTIVAYCEHDSFLIHHEEDNLTVEEQNQVKNEVVTFILLFH